MDPGEMSKLVKGMSDELTREQEKTVQVAKAQSTLFNQSQDGSMTKEQLDVSEILESADHMLRGHTLKMQGQNLVWVEPQDDNMRILNDYGVQVIMEIVTMYVHKSTLMGNYTENQINFKMKELGTRIKNAIYCKYEYMGMDTPNKRKMYPLIVKQIVDIIHGAYTRSLNGEERDSLRRQMYITESKTVGGPQGMMQPQNQKRFSVFKPWTW